MAFIKKSNFLSSVYFGQIKQEKIVFLLFWRKKNSFLDQKGKLKKSPKIRHFPRRLVHGFCQKIELFVIFVFWANQTRKDRFLVFRIKKTAF